MVEYLDRFWTPTGLYVVVREIIGSGGFYVVRVYNFATWKHREVEFEDASAAMRYADLWRI